MKENNWIPCNTLPANETIKIFFHGLLSFSHFTENNSDENWCEIGVHNASQSHNLQIKIYDLTLPYSERLIHSYAPANTKSIKDRVFTLEVPNIIPAVSYFQPNGFNRQEDQGDEKDFRWIVDLESSEFYNQELVKVTDVIMPRFHIKIGTFYTLYKSKSKYKRVANGRDNGLEIGRIAYYMGANIYLDADHPAILTIDKEIRLDPSKQYIIGITNNCEERNYFANNEESRTDTDFVEYYKTFQLPSGTDRYDLMYTNRFKEDFDVNQLIGQNRMRGHKRANDATPCGVVGHGQSNGLPRP